MRAGGERWAQQPEPAAQPRVALDRPGVQPGLVEEVLFEHVNQLTDRAGAQFLLELPRQESCKLLARLPADQLSAVGPAIHREDLEKRLAEHKLVLELTDKAKSWLVKTGYDPVYGARPLRRAIERYVENPLSTKILRGELGDLNNTVIAILGLSFKPGTNDVRAAPSISIIQALWRAGATIVVHDPLIARIDLRSFRRFNITVTSSVEECLRGADACLLLTEWSEYSNLELDYIVKEMRKKLIAFIILLLALSFLVVGILEAQIALIEPFYEEMSDFEAYGASVN